MHSHLHSVACISWAHIFLSSFCYFLTLLVPNSWLPLTFVYSHAHPALFMYILNLYILCIFWAQNESQLSENHAVSEVLWGFRRFCKVFSALNRGEWVKWVKRLVSTVLTSPNITTKTWVGNLLMIWWPYVISDLSKASWADRLGIEGEQLAAPKRRWKPVLMWCWNLLDITLQALCKVKGWKFGIQVWFAIRGFQSCQAKLFLKLTKVFTEVCK